MPRTCNCSGNCGQPEPDRISRRTFIRRASAGAAALSVAGRLTHTDGRQPLTPIGPVALDGFTAYPLTPPRVYSGANLEVVAMPIGGIGTGSIWLNGQGQLGVWQIFNNLNENRIPHGLFAIRTRTATGTVRTRILQTVSELSLTAVESREYQAGYPIAKLSFHDSQLPVEVTMEATNPLVPLDAARSSIPCALFRLTAKNTGTSAVEVTLFGTLQNAVGSGGNSGISGVNYAGYGGNRNTVVVGPDLVSVAMDRLPDPVASGWIQLRDADGALVPGVPLLWQVALNSLPAQTADLISPLVREGGVLIADGLTPAFFTELAQIKAGLTDFDSVAIVFDDFEGRSYPNWDITGTAFGCSPAHGTLANQQVVSGYAGQGLVNTYLGGDGPQGTATSKPFTIQRRYIGFLLGGGNHPNETCINLKVNGSVVRTATSVNLEALVANSWDVNDLVGQQAVLEMVDRNSGGWGHINVDQIIFSDVPPEPLLQQETSRAVVAKALKAGFTSAETVNLPSSVEVVATAATPPGLAALIGGAQVTTYTRLVGFQDGVGGYRVLAATATGDPLIIDGPLGKGRIVMVLSPSLPWAWGTALLAAERPTPLREGDHFLAGDTTWGTMALAAFDSTAVALPAWASSTDLTGFMGDLTHGQPAGTQAVSTSGKTIDGALGVPFTLEPGAERTVDFAITWHFPNVQRYEHAGNLYCRQWPDAQSVAAYLANQRIALWDRTRLYRDSLYQSNIPEEFIDAMSSQSVIFRGPTVFWSEDGYFGGYEGCYGCCPLNCTHVWNYAHSHARLFPALGQNMRVSNFITYLHASGETSHREHAIHGAFIDGHCACIVGAYREYQLSTDLSVLAAIWPGVRKATDWLIQAIDAAHTGTTHGQQWNTYDTAVSGNNTFIGSQYLAALAAAEQMALIMGDNDSAQRWHTVLDAGKANQNSQLWNGQFYIQIPEGAGARDYNTGCHADQLLGQWWAHQLNLGFLYPPERVTSALAAISTHNFRADVTGFTQTPRRYVVDGEGGLIICTWPNGGRPSSFILYADEVWTGIEYAAAGAMVHAGLLTQARQIVSMARSRYDGRRRNGLNSGPGGNPFNELECGKFYARAMSSWSLLIAAQGLVLDGPKGVLGFKPNWQPEDHRSFFTAPAGWGIFAQQRQANEQTERIEVRYGVLRLRELVFALPSAAAATANVLIGGQTVAATLQQTGRDARLVLAQEAVVSEGAAVEVTFNWA